MKNKKPSIQNQDLKELNEDTKDILLSQQVLQDIKTGQTKTISHKKMMQKLGWNK